MPWALVSTIFGLSTLHQIRAEEILGMLGYILAGRPGWHGTV